MFIIYNSKLVSVKNTMGLVLVFSLHMSYLIYTYIMNTKNPYTSLSSIFISFVFIYLLTKEMRTRYLQVKHITSRSRVTAQ